MKKFPLAPFLVLALLALLAGLWAGLIRLGWQLPRLANSIPLYHGALMVSGFTGTVIALERAAALKRRWMLAAPLLSGIGWVAGLLFPATIAAPVLFSLASLVALLILTVIVRRESKIHTWAMWIGMLFWLFGNLLWLDGYAVPVAVPFWQAFLILTISGERLELSRVLRPTRLQHMLFAGAVAIYLFGVVSTIFVGMPGWQIAGAGMIFLSAWLVIFDLARRNLRHRIPLTRYIATCLFLGYLWLGFAGVQQIIFGAQSGGFYYDAMLHSVFLGFVISMIFGHAPIILPALLGVMVRYHPISMANLVLLHLSLALRVFGDLTLSLQLRKWGGLLNEVAFIIFLGITIYTVAGSKRPSKSALFDLNQ